MTTEQVKMLNDENFDVEISSGVTLVDFFAEWCAPCKMLSPILDEIAEKMAGQAQVAKVDVDQAQNVTATLQVTSVPTLILFKDGQEVNRIVGIKDADAIEEAVKAAL